MSITARKRITFSTADHQAATVAWRSTPYGYLEDVECLCHRLFKTESIDVADIVPGVYTAVRVTSASGLTQLSQSSLYPNSSTSYVFYR